MLRNRKKTLGQAMTEYIIIVVLCAIGLLLVVTFFGNDLKELFFSSSNSLRQGKQQAVNYDDSQAGTNFTAANDDHNTAELDK